MLVRDTGIGDIGAVMDERHAAVDCNSLVAAIDDRYTITRGAYHGGENKKQLFPLYEQSSIS